MAAYTKTVFAHAIGAANPPQWYTDAISSGDVADRGGGLWQVAGPSGWINTTLGAYVTYKTSPTVFGVIAAVTFEAEHTLLPCDC